MRKVVGIAVVLFQVALLMGAAIPTIAYWIHPEIFAAACENKGRPCMHCCGKCKLRKATASALGVGGDQNLREDHGTIPPPADSWLEDATIFGVAINQLGVFQVRRDRPTDNTPLPEVPPPKV